MLNFVLVHMALKHAFYVHMWMPTCIYLTGRVHLIHYFNHSITLQAWVEEACWHSSGIKKSQQRDGYNVKINQFHKELSKSWTVAEFNWTFQVKNQNLFLLMWNEKHVLFFFKNWKNHNLIIFYVKKTVSYYYFAWKSWSVYYFIKKNHNLVFPTK